VPVWAVGVVRKSPRRHPLEDPRRPTNVSLPRPGGWPKFVADPTLRKRRHGDAPWPLTLCSESAKFHPHRNDITPAVARRSPSPDYLPNLSSDTSEAGQVAAGGSGTPAPGLWIRRARRCCWTWAWTSPSILDPAKHKRSAPKRMWDRRGYQLEGILSYRSALLAVRGQLSPRFPTNSPDIEQTGTPHACNWSRSRQWLATGSGTHSRWTHGGHRPVRFCCLPSSLQPLLPTDCGRRVRLAVELTGFLSLVFCVPSSAGGAECPAPDSSLACCTKTSSPPPAHPAAHPQPQHGTRIRWPLLGRPGAPGPGGCRADPWERASGPGPVWQALLPACPGPPPT